MDVPTILGMVLAFAALLIAIVMEGGSIGGFINISAAIIVLGGTAGATTIGLSFKEIKIAPQVMKQAFFGKPIDSLEVAGILIEFSRKARREGILALEDDVRKVPIPFIRRGMSLVIDGTSADLVREVLETELDSMQARHRTGISIFDTMGGFAPTLGILGTVMGLVNMLANLDEPGEMGHAIAAAFIATLYGVGVANLVFLPIANKLKAKSAEETHAYEMAIEGILALQSGDSPRVVTSKMQSFISPKHKEQTGQKV
jgi:chemotaxis protein MotA